MNVDIDKILKKSFAVPVYVVIETTPSTTPEIEGTTFTTGSDVKVIGVYEDHNKAIAEAIVPNRKVHGPFPLTIKSKTFDPTVPDINPFQPEHPKFPTPKIHPHHPPGVPRVPNFTNNMDTDDDKPF